MRASIPASAIVAKNFTGSPMPAKASTCVPASAATTAASGSNFAWNSGRARAARDERGCAARAQQRLMADLCGGVRCLDNDRPGNSPAVAARKEKRPLARDDQQPRDRDRRGRLARAAHGQIADADYRNAGG